MDEGAHTMTPAVAEELRRLRAENERLRDGIRQHRRETQSAAFTWPAADDDLWALLEEDDDG